AAAIELAQPIPFASNMTNSVSALPLSVNSDRQQPVKILAKLAAGGPCQSVIDSVPGCPEPEFNTLMAWENGADAPVVVMSPRMLLTRKPKPSMNAGPDIENSLCLTPWT